MGCVCCMSEEARTGALMKNFLAVPASGIAEGAVNKIIGYGTSIPNAFLAHPLTGEGCLWYEFIVRETRHWEERYKDSEGHQRTRQKSESKIIFRHEGGAEFLLADGKSAIQVDLRNEKQSKLKTTFKDHRNHWPSGTKPPPHIANFLNYYPRKDQAGIARSAGQGFGGMMTAAVNAASNVYHNERYTYSYNLSHIPAGQKVCVIGFAQGGKLHAITETTLSDKYFEDNSWTSKNIKIWKEEVKGAGAIFITNDDEDIKMVTVSAYEGPQEQKMTFYIPPYANEYKQFFQPPPQYQQDHKQGVATQAPPQQQVVYTQPPQSSVPPQQQGVYQQFPQGQQQVVYQQPPQGQQVIYNQPPKGQVMYQQPPQGQQGQVVYQQPPPGQQVVYAQPPAQ
eukprot:CAMPEP_0167766962 /NCGR_PEP_ID=MMETSP0110_2-20121227/15718_1 /TAXON_ID=629695 /ORGANISM="Gymnochlora sp., Strain CCMP2014" /LENGTH=393 /DNA_ID=CAMNT_0007655213 /DNA_START=23 /DNA_END=1204 /DNA_ORIENTATION=+